MGPIASRGGSVPEFLRKPIATCDFPPLGPRILGTENYGVKMCFGSNIALRVHPPPPMVMIVLNTILIGINEHQKILDIN